MSGWATGGLARNLSATPFLSRLLSEYFVVNILQNLIASRVKRRRQWRHHVSNGSSQSPSITNWFTLFILFYFIFSSFKKMFIRPLVWVVFAFQHVLDYRFVNFHGRSRLRAASCRRLAPNPFPFFFIIFSPLIAVLTFWKTEKKKKIDNNLKLHSLPPCPLDQYLWSLGEEEKKKKETLHNHNLSKD